MPRSLWQFLAESGLAYAVALAAALPVEAAIVYPIDWVTHGRISRQLLFALTSPVLAEFWITAAVAAAIVAWRAQRSPESLFRASRAGEWVWVAGAVYIVFCFLSYLPVSHHWARAALYELFANTDDIGNLPTAPFYMGIAYSLTRRLLRMRAGGRTAVVGGTANRAS